MSSPSPCVPCCTTPQTVAVPGPEGVGGADGLDGVNAYSLLTTPFTSDGTTTWTLGVSSSAWMVPGQIIVIGDATNGPVHLRVVSVPSATSVIAVELNYAGDGIGDAIPVGAKVAPSGGGIAMYSGSDTLVVGTQTVSVPVLTANSVILATWSDPDAATVGVLSIPTATRTPGTPGTFVINSVKADGTTPLNTDTGSFDWLVIG